ncbi:MAG: enoyl-CoA hydratase/isomerase family protein [Planctomycetes bacterium]|nr:enoyl-CoA hydratase/isomerase family protein [Planctomycetota bacterium]
MSEDQIIPATRVRGVRILEGAAWRIDLRAPKGNIIDRVMMAELEEHFRAAGRERSLRAILLAAEGPHFSYGASIEEHRADQVAAMLAGFRALFRAITEAAVPVVAATRGLCLGGGLELAAFCQRLIARPDAVFGQPEITLGVFAPFASLILPERCGRGPAETLLLGGGRLTAPEARAIGLVDEIAEDPEEAATAFIRERLLPHSAAALRFALRAARHDFNERFERGSEVLERLYLDGLMATQDAHEGLDAFLAHRRPDWKHR